VTGNQSSSGSKSCLISINAGETGFGKWGGVINYPSSLGRGDEVWFRVRTYMPAGFNYDADPRLKFLRIHTKGSDGSNIGYNDVYIMPSGSNPPLYWIYEGNVGSMQGGGNVKYGTSADKIQKGVWETYEVYIRFDTAPDRTAPTVGNGDGDGVGRVKVWKNGKLLLDHGERTLKQSDAMSGKAHIFTYWNGGSPATQSMYIDDVVLTSDRPAATDANGNAYIGVGNVVVEAAPGSPTGLH